MAATNYTPISLYYTTTAAATPSAGNLVAGELALNTVDEKLYFKNSTGTVKLLASNSGSSGSVTSVAQSFTGGIVSVAGSPITTSGTLALTVAGTSGGIPYFASSSTWATSAALTQYGVVYGGGAGAAPVATANGTTGQAFIATTSGAPSWGTLPIAGGGTNSTATATAGGVGYGTGTAHAYTGASTGGYILTSGGAGAPAFIQTLPVANGGTGQTTYTDGQLLIGNTTGNTLTKTTLTAGSGITITNGSGAITIASSGGSQATPTSLGTVYGKTDTALTTANLGYQAGNALTGDRNVSIGYQANLSGTTSSTVTAVGYQAIGGSGNAQRATAIGFQALYSHAGTNTNFNTAVGWQSGYAVTTGADNTSMGHGALYSISTGNDCTAIGHSSQTNMIGSNNTSLGSFALNGSGTPANNTGTNNIAVGMQAGYSNTSGTDNISMGREAVYTNQTGINNIGIGSYALNLNTSSYSTAVGYSALQLSTGASNVAVGTSALYNVSSGATNTALGREAGLGVTTGSNNLYLGYGSSASGGTATYELVVGVNSTGKGGGTGYINAASGGTYNGANTTTWATTSDRRLKKNIVDNNVGLEKISQIQVRNFEYRTEDEVTELPKHSVIKKEGVQLGAIAQEMFEILPDCVKTETTGVMSLNTDSIMWHMINAIKELNAKVIALEARLGA